MLEKKNKLEIKYYKEGCILYDNDISDLIELALSYCDDVLELRDVISELINKYWLYDIEEGTIKGLIECYFDLDDILFNEYSVVDKLVEWLADDFFDCYNRNKIKIGLVNEEEDEEC